MTKNVSRLKIARVAAGLSQFELAQKVEVNEVAISRIETGRTTAPSVLKTKIAAILNKSTFEIFEK